ncbi:amino acid/amide ABC transporter substrate-binding protein, HAAT family [Rhizobium tibeticum]|uniref:Amino acid/amide ABC transporter substrate-binding protein, HAAT family n=1 Tax=Rhizobium tibeticum TaxID=501024 RepID=A0A1H8W029_9HYPH|nr:ABC transporter substrate-binding protein [Rhizobium tibeticum]SEI20049.1 leucine ABC transporter subunit substrate-binding protein LivK [Rhizobium tibeticum]SEP20950.1 amino acid/amide ABC transporter substrate-binding protein, HAAT family [Rhizobium tibeticum]
MMTSPAQAQDPIRIGFVMAKQGAQAEHGKHHHEGTMIALKEFNNTARGQPVEVIWLDEPTPQDAQQNMQRLIDEQKVVAVVGGGNSATALAMSAVAKQNKIPFIATNAAATDIIGAKCHRYTFRVQLPVIPQVRALADELKNRGHNWYYMAASYAFGQDVVRSFQTEGKKIGATTVAVDEAPINTADYTSYILKIRAAKPDVVVGGLGGNDISTFLKQWNEMGMRDRGAPFAQIGVADTDIWGIGAAAASGIYTKIWYYDNPNNPDEDKKLAADYMKEHGHPASDRVWMGWYSMRTLLQALNSADSLKAADIVKSLEAWKDEKRGTTFRSWDHQMLNPVVLAEVKKQVTKDYEFLDVLRSVPGSDALYGTREEVGCNIGDL